MDFNPRSREGSDGKLSSIKNTVSEFQSTLPRGERLIGGDGRVGYDEISIHAPARGATTSV